MFWIFLSPLLVTYTYKFQIEWCRMSHIGTYLSPGSINCTICKFYQIERILNITLQVTKRHMRIHIWVLKLTSQTATQYRQRFRTDFFGKLEELIKSQTITLVIIGKEPMRESILPTIFIQRTVLYHTYRLFPVVA